MNIEQRVEKALDFHHQGYNCAQSVACAFADLLKDHAEAVFKMTEGFGFGVGDTKSVCGAVSGAVCVLGMLNSDGPGGKTKGATYKLVRELKNDFTERNTTTVCSELKGVETGNVIRTCDGCIEDAVRATAMVIENSIDKTVNL